MVACFASQSIAGVTAKSQQSASKFILHCKNAVIVSVHNDLRHSVCTSRTIENVLSHHRECPLAPSRMSSRTIENALSHHRECPLAPSRMSSRTIENVLSQAALLCGKLRSTAITHANDGNRGTPSGVFWEITSPQTASSLCRGLNNLSIHLSSVYIYLKRLSRSNKKRGMIPSLDPTADNVFCACSEWHAGIVT